MGACTLCTCSVVSRRVVACVYRPCVHDQRGSVRTKRAKSCVTVRQCRRVSCIAHRLLPARLTATRFRFISEGVAATTRGSPVGSGPREQTTNDERKLARKRSAGTPSAFATERRWSLNDGRGRRLTRRHAAVD